MDEVDPVHSVHLVYPEETMPKKPKPARKAIAVKRPRSSKIAAPRTATGLATLARGPAETQKYILGSSKIFTPEVINDIHIKAELGR